MDLNIATIALIALAIAGIVTILVLYKQGKEKEIYSMVKLLVDEAENRFGSGTGKLKYEYVVEKIYTLLPGYIKVFVSDRLIDIWIETAVNELQEVLDKKLKEESK